jgi:hypothetical protein
MGVGGITSNSEVDGAMNNRGIHIIKAHAPFMGAWYAEFSIHTRRNGAEGHEFYRVQSDALWRGKEKIASGRQAVHDVLAEILQCASVEEQKKLTPREFWIYVDGWCQGHD